MSTTTAMVCMSPITSGVAVGRGGGHDPPPPQFAFILCLIIVVNVKIYYFYVWCPAIKISGYTAKHHSLVYKYMYVIYETDCIRLMVPPYTLNYCMLYSSE